MYIHVHTCMYTVSANLIKSQILWLLQENAKFGKTIIMNGYRVFVYGTKRVISPDLAGPHSLHYDVIMIRAHACTSPDTTTDCE